MNIYTNFSTRLQRHFAKYVQSKRFIYGFSIFCVVAIKFQGTESSIAAEKYLWVCCKFDDKKLPSKRLFGKIMNMVKW